MEITDEMRKVVREELCRENGHQLRFNNLLDHTYSAFISGQERDDLPHVTCTVCPRVWVLVEEDSATTYDEAEAKLQSRLKATDDLSKLITEIRNKRGKKNA